jgi:surface carbohydrate biosynthesis protein (TIGR04326 family)
MTTQERQKNGQNYSEKLIYIRDSSDGLLDKEAININWKTRVHNPIGDVYSILEILELNIEKFRTQFLDQIGSLSERKIGFKKLPEFFTAKSGFSFWWIAEINEFANLTKSTEADEALKMLALVDLVQNLKYTRIILVSEDYQLFQKLTRLFPDISLDNHTLNSRLSEKPKKVVPIVIKKIVFGTRYYLNKKALIGVGLEKTKSPDITVFTYSDNFEGNVGDPHSFASGYWGNLPSMLTKKQLTVQWVNIYGPDRIFQSSRRYAQALNSWNDSDDNLNQHLSLDSFLSKRIIFVSLIESIVLSTKADSIRRRVISKTAPSPLDAYLDSIWKKSFNGVGLFENLIFEKLISKAVNHSKSSSMCLYLQENQSWEKSLLQHWRRISGMPIVGFPHTLFSPWDFRYFTPSLEKFPEYSRTLPDFFACSNKINQENLEKLLIPRNRIKQVEALRYFQLLRTIEPTQPKSNLSIERRILLIGDFSTESTRNLLKVVNCAHQSVPSNFQITFKPHPNALLSEEEVQSYDVEYSTEELTTLVDGSEIVICTMLTSAAVNVVFRNRKLIVFTSENQINSSPVFFFKQVCVANSLEELQRDLLDQINPIQVLPTDFFNLDLELSGWSELVNGMVRK